jgi:hypothetical protein
MKHLLVVALVLAPLPAFAQDIVSIVVTSPNVGSIIQQWTLTPDEMAKFQAWLQYAYPCKPTGPPPARQCDVPTDSIIESIKLWETATINGTVDNVNKAGAQKTAQDAVSGITPIVPQMASKTEPAAAKKK